METENIWYILKGEEKQGPYTYANLISFIQNNQLFEYSFVWAPHLENWTMIHELAEFSKDRYLNILQNNKDLANNFSRRTSPRMQKRIPLFVHNNLDLYEGSTVEVSYYGALVSVNTPLLLPGEQILLHFTAGKDLAFNLTAEIIRKIFTTKKININSGLQYAVRYLQIPEVALKHFKTIIQEKENTNGIS